MIIIIQKDYLTMFLDIEFLEQKAFDVCDMDEDGGLSWDEVEICEVCMNSLFRNYMFMLVKMTYILKICHILGIQK